MNNLVLDHFTVLAPSLDAGVAYAQEALGVKIPVGGAHPVMGTHNHLLRLGDALFFEVIAIDPDAAAPSHPRWFNLDNLGDEPRLGAWVLGTDDIIAALATAPESARKARQITRGSLTWQISIADDGTMLFDGAFPSFIQWPKGPHPASGMTDTGCRLKSLVIEHPEADEINELLRGKFSDPKVKIVEAAVLGMTAEIETPNGVRYLR